MSYNCLGRRHCRHMLDSLDLRTPGATAQHMPCDCPFGWSSTCYPLGLATWSQGSGRWGPWEPRRVGRALLRAVPCAGLEPAQGKVGKTTPWLWPLQRDSAPDQAQCSRPVCLCISCHYPAPGSRGAHRCTRPGLVGRVQGLSWEDVPGRTSNTYLRLHSGEGLWGVQSTAWGVAWLEERPPSCVRWGLQQGHPSGAGQQAQGQGGSGMGAWLHWFGHPGSGEEEVCRRSVPASCPS